MLEMRKNWVCYVQGLNFWEVWTVRGFIEGVQEPCRSGDDYRESALEGELYVKERG